jgi:hypothetical protein
MVCSVQWLLLVCPSFPLITFILISSHIGHVPFIRAPRGNAAEMIAKKLETKIRDALLSASRTHSSTSSLFAQDSTGFSSLQRPRKPIIY